MIYRSSRELPTSLRGCAIWMQVFDGVKWNMSNCLRAHDARQLARFLDRNPDVVWLRIYTEKI